MPNLKPRRTLEGIVPQTPEPIPKSHVLQNMNSNIPNYNSNKAFPNIIKKKLQYPCQLYPSDDEDRHVDRKVGNSLPPSQMCPNSGYNSEYEFQKSL